MKSNDLIFKTNRESIKNNLALHLENAIASKDKDKIELIEKLQSEIEKYLVLKSVMQSEKLANFFKDDIANVVKDSSFNIIEMILIKEIELLEIGDFKAIAMLNKIKNKAQAKLQELNKIALNFHEKQKADKVSMPLIDNKIEQQNSKSNIEYKTLIPIEGFHLEKTLGGQYIQTLDADIKNLVGNEIINSKPEDLSKVILEQIKNMKHDSNQKSLDNKENKGHWTKKIKEELVDKSVNESR